MSDSLTYASDEIERVCPGCEDSENTPHLPPCDLAWDLPMRTWRCVCGVEVARYRGQDDVACGSCGRWYNCFGQQLRDDWAGNPSLTNDDIGDLDGYEIQQLRKELRL